MLKKQIHEKNVIFVIIVTLKILVLNMNHIFVIVVIDGLMQKAMNFIDVTIVSIKGSDCRIYFWYMSKDD